MPRVCREYADEEDALKVELMGMAIIATAGPLVIAAAFLINWGPPPPLPPRPPIDAPAKPPYFLPAIKPPAKLYA